MKFYVVVNYYLGSLCYKFHEDPCTNAHAQVEKIACAHVLSRVRGFDSCARICARIFMKLKTLAHKIVIDHHIEFHEDPSFGCGDISKTLLTLP